MKIIKITPEQLKEKIKLFFTESKEAHTSLLTTPNKVKKVTLVLKGGGTIFRHQLFEGSLRFYNKGVKCLRTDDLDPKDYSFSFMKALIGVELNRKPLTANSYTSIIQKLNIYQSITLEIDEKADIVLHASTHSLEKDEKPVDISKQNISDIKLDLYEDEQEKQIKELKERLDMAEQDKILLDIQLKATIDKSETELKSQVTTLMKDKEDLIDALGEKNKEIDRVIETAIQKEKELKAEINHLIKETEDLKLKGSSGASEVFKTFNERLLVSRTNYAKIAALEAEKAAHLSKSETPFVDEKVLIDLKNESYLYDTKCLGDYQSFPQEIKMGTILFAFWEMAHHNRFYRSFFVETLNDRKKAVNADDLTVALHYMDCTRVLMGHYAHIAKKQWNLDLFPVQTENNARFGMGTDIVRDSAEAAFFI